MAYVKANIAKPGGMPGKGINPKDAAIIYDVDDILSFPARDDAGVVIEDDIVMKDGKYAVAIYFTPGTAQIQSNSEGDPDAQGFRPQVQFSHPGSGLEIREFKHNWLGKNVIVVLRYCDGRPADLIGSPCNPCQLAVEYTGSNEANSSQLTFAQISKGEDVAIYLGSDTLATPVAVIAAEATEVTYAGEGQYQTTSGAAEITSVSGTARDGAVITILGTAGTAPTVKTGGNILLRGGAAFTASEGSQITLKAFPDGVSSIKWIEQSRYQA